MLPLDALRMPPVLGLFASRLSHVLLLMLAHEARQSTRPRPVSILCYLDFVTLIRMRTLHRVQTRRCLARVSMCVNGIRKSTSDPEPRAGSSATPRSTLYIAMLSIICHPDHSRAQPGHSCAPLPPLQTPAENAQDVLVEILRAKLPLWQRPGIANKCRVAPQNLAQYAA
jgi:hypothetical protein